LFSWLTSNTGISFSLIRSTVLKVVIIRRCQSYW
jgi:hypothetical protein